ncbi:MAG: right-handed parallel beta-helix repeat-containing protein [Ancrocorticia sp.]
MSLSGLGAAALCASLVAGGVPAVGAEEPNDPTPTMSATPEQETAPEGDTEVPSEVVSVEPTLAASDPTPTASEDPVQPSSEDPVQPALAGLDAVEPAALAYGNVVTEEVNSNTSETAAATPANTQTLSSWDDAFNRNVTKGWGASYSTDGSSPSAAFSVNGQRGEMRLPAGHTGIANTVNFFGLDVNAKVTVRVSAVPTSGYGTFTGLNLRVSNGSFYRATLRLAPDGVAAIKIERVGSTTTTLVQDIKLPFTPKASTDYNFEFQANGTSKVELNARAWPLGSTAPAWQAKTTDSSGSRIATPGAASIRSFLHGSGPATIFAYDNFKLTSLSTSTPTPTPNPTPTPTPTPTTPPDPAPPISEPGSSIRANAGSLPIGQAKYPYPANAIFVRAAGNTSGSGTQANPYGSLAKALSVAPTGSTIVLRGGTYHESVTVPFYRKLTIQPYPGEAVWLDGAETFSSWAQSGSAWRTKWTYDFDNRVSHTVGKHEEWFVNPAYPASRYPEQVWIDGRKLTQVLSLSQVREGTFFVDGTNDWLYIGTNPSGKKVEASTLQQALKIQGEGTTVRGIGVKRYAAHLALMGTVSSQVANIRLENMVITDNSMVGLSGWNPNQVWNKLTVTNNGLLGIGAGNADGLKITNSLVSGNNSERFNTEPVAGGIKITRSKNVSVTGTVAERNIASTGIWFDEWNQGVVAANNVSVDNGQYGIEVEVSDNAVVAGNYLLRNGGAGIYVLGTSNASVWNNSITGEAGRPIYNYQDNRKGSRTDVPIDLRNLSIKNNVVNLGTNNCPYLIDDSLDKLHWTDKEFNFQSNGNVFRKSSTNSNIACMAVGPQHVVGIKTHAELIAGGQEKQSVVFDGGAPITTSTGTLTSRATDVESQVAQPLPSNVANALGISAQTKKLGPTYNP